VNRRQLLRAAANAGAVPFVVWLAGCAPSASAAGPRAIQWNREVCTQCGMVLSDRRFAVQMQGGATNGHWNFDDIGCALTWLAARGWPASQQPRLWVADIEGGADTAEPHWLEAPVAHYHAGRNSPMGYGFGASAAAAAGSIGFAELRERVLSSRSRMP
jgi:copper chaperone NosL